MLENLSIPDPSVLIEYIQYVDPGTLKIILIGGTIFLFAILMAFARHHLIETSLHGLWAGIATGVFVVLGVEGALFFIFQNYVVGSKANELPENFQIVLKDSTQNLNKVLGVKAEKELPSAQSLLLDYKQLGETDLELVHSAICKPE